MRSPTIRSRYQLIIPGIFGNLLEIYDFMVYGYFATIIAKLFFPHDNKYLGLLLTFGIFALGFIMRPLGAIIFGHYGDRLGRKKPLTVAIILMASATTLIGLLPSYASIGVWAGILLLICRLLQGIAMGGEFAGSILYVTEHAPSSQRGFYGSWAMCGTFAGILLASLISALTTLFFSVNALHSWGWRIPFLLGSILGIIGLYLRLRMPETPFFLAIKAQQKLVSSPFLQIFRQAFTSLLIIAGLNFLPAVAFYILFIYFSSYLTAYLKFPLHTALTINTLNVLLLTFLTPLFGWWSDKIGRKPILIIGCLGFILLSYPLFLLLQYGHNAFMPLLVQACFALLVALVFAALPATIVELMRTPIRYTGVALGYNLSSALFGGTAPLLATYFVAKLNLVLFPCYYLIFAGIGTLLIVFLLPETHQQPLP